MARINWMKTMSIAGTVLGLISTVLSGKAQQKNMEKAVAEEVTKQLRKR